MIYYSHVNEDNQVERKEMSKLPFAVSWCISGSGERVISLLDHEALQDMYAIDHNPEALWLLDLKLCALKALKVSDYLEFIGMTKKKPTDRLSTFRTFRESLLSQSRRYWDGRSKTVNRGVLHCGHFEKFLSRTRPALRLTLGRGYEEILNKPLSACHHFPLRRWNGLKKLFAQRFSYWFMGNRDTAFIARDASQQIIPNAIQEELEREPENRSFMFHLVFFGHLDHLPRENRPVSLRETFLERVKERLLSGKLRVHLIEGDLLQEFSKKSKYLSGNVFFSLSDLLSFVDFKYLQEFCIAEHFAKITFSQLVLRAFLRHPLSDHDRAWLEKHMGALRNISWEERTAMYQVYSFSHDRSEV